MHVPGSDRKHNSPRLPSTPSRLLPAWRRSWRHHPSTTPAALPPSPAQPGMHPWTFNRRSVADNPTWVRVSRGAGEGAGCILPVADERQRSSHQTSLIIASFLKPLFSQRDRHDHIHLPVKPADVAGKMPGNCISKGNIPPVFEAVQSTPDRAFENQPGTQLFVWESMIPAEPAFPRAVDWDAALLADGLGQGLNLMLALRTPEIPGTITAPAYRWEQPVQTAPKKLV